MTNTSKQPLLVTSKTYKHNTTTYVRLLIKTSLFQKGDDFPKKIASEVAKASAHIKNIKKMWYLVVSEKIVAISQGRSYFIKDIKAGWWAVTLSRFVSKTPFGIGLGSQWTMQLAINEVGLPRILFAALVSVLTKPLGIRGLFYHIVGREIAAIDGPTEYSLYPSNVSAKLAPKNPQKAAADISKEIKKLKIHTQFGGTVIADANDLGVNILGNDTDKPDLFFVSGMKDNPMGQGREQTPLAIFYAA